MLTPQFLLPVHNELVVDLFAGGGGASTGIEQAIGRPVDISVNHDPEAVALHTVNHPQTQHYVSDVFEINPLVATRGQPVGLLWASPDCKHFSKAKGGKPVSKRIRGLAWVVVKWAKAVRPRVIILENVEEFQTWGPLTDDGMPCPERKGETFEMWRAQLRELGYRIEHRELRACDYGTPTIRKRFFMVARRDGLPITWPTQTHFQRPAKGQTAWRTAAEIIDWSIPCPSIFERSKPLADATCRRIAKGIMRYVVDSADPFIVNLTHGGRLEPLNEPLKTVTGAHRGEKALVMPTLIQTGYGERPGQSPRVPGLDKPLGTIVGTQKHALVGAFLAATSGPTYSQKPRAADAPLNTVTTDSRASIVTAFLAKHYTGVVGSDVRDPIGTVTSVDHHSLVTANLIHMGHGERKAGGKRFSHGIRDIKQPLNTVTASGCPAGLVTSHLVKLRNNCVGQDVRAPIDTITTGGHFGEVRAFLLKYYGTDQDPQLNEPLHTITTKDRFGLVTVHGVGYQIVDIGLRMLSPRELYRAQGFPDGYIIDRTADGNPITKTAQVRMCGNSVCPPLAQAIVAANYREQQDMRKSA
ncbi:DNA (cytosine-5-)-methyltransferase [Bordetella sp. J329]|nr:DNA (cytosine-5-)-methyltransferase [Bordetella sp. J329]